MARPAEHLASHTLWVGDKSLEDVVDPRARAGRVQREHQVGTSDLSSRVCLVDSPISVRFVGRA